ncbi:SMP-30/gluconolactonase/LRE family protein [Rhodococcus aetherivorans]|uniref:SMP-30/gluconolactonase/LRE family protein n=1 Tax=Rhodococcus zopfii TaxID=43772 RepID=UPI001EDD7748|nr:SMP-30/gluconolactonase/LRE family protein [Rhodococcus zopfii]
MMVTDHFYSKLSSGHGFLESPRFHNGTLYLSDFFNGRVITMDPTTGAWTKIADVPNSPSGLGFTDDGGILIVSQHDHKLLRRDPNGTITEFADLSKYCGGDANDMRVVNGHCYIGNFGFDLAGGADPETTNLIHVTPDGTVSAEPGDVLFPNGAELLPDGTTLLLSETLAHKISAFQVQPDGSLTDYRTWAQLPETHNPDGMTVDSDGGVWYANALTEGPESGFYRVEEGGEITDRILVEKGWGVALTFGGPDNDILFLVNNDTTLPDFAQGRSAGYVLTAKVGRRGAN